ncbi:DUF397 domain-containing protein [Streptomyces buecherae]|uniref:DUF397 domain-containing protein n=1 Tax=Streptomyces buecherae TaxID=2763006 RepID=A0A7H8NEC5_9ACTN|nr:DUF397 domain-containing protein [Streptomyces buecherae]QKW52058.1 DUF397 domain-containing protein [Streptomyces buecherae]
MHRWVKSSYSGGEGGQCVEWDPGHATITSLVPVRDSKDPHGPTLAFTPTAWHAFIASIKAGEFRD